MAPKEKPPERPAILSEGPSTRSGMNETSLQRTLSTVQMCEYRILGAILVRPERLPIATAKLEGAAFTDREARSLYWSCRVAVRRDPDLPVAELEAALALCGLSSREALDLIARATDAWSQAERDCRRDPDSVFASLVLSLEYQHRSRRALERALLDGGDE